MAEGVGAMGDWRNKAKAIAIIAALLLLSYMAIRFPAGWMSLDSISTIAEIFVAIGTLALALATYGFTRDVRRQTKRDRINREMDLLILPLKTAYHEIDSRGGIDGLWWELCFGPMRTMTDPVAAQRFRNAVENIDRYRHLAPENLCRLIDEFLVRLNDVKRAKDSGDFGIFQKSLAEATKGLYYNSNVEGGAVEYRYYELTKGLDTLNNDEMKSWWHFW